VLEVELVVYWLSVTRTDVFIPQRRQESMRKLRWQVSGVVLVVKLVVVLGLQFELRDCSDTPHTWRGKHAPIWLLFRRRVQEEIRHHRCRTQRASMEGWRRVLRCVRAAVAVVTHMDDIDAEDASAAVAAAAAEAEAAVEGAEGAEGGGKCAGIC
jgi:hypothetical protein